MLYQIIGAFSKALLQLKREITGLVNNAKDMFLNRLPLLA
jgi:hypothetical protein